SKTKYPLKKASNQGVVRTPKVRGKTPLWFLLGHGWACLDNRAVPIEIVGGRPGDDEPAVATTFADFCPLAQSQQIAVSLQWRAVMRRPSEENWSVAAI